MLLNMRVKLDALLEERGLATSRLQAQTLIAAGKVWVGGQPATKAAMLVSPETDISIRERVSWVSRGALKLLRALETFSLSPAGACCLDVGASTGGFTEVLLRHGARQVVAVDVGYGQLAWSLRTDPRVVVRERTNARYLLREDFPELFSFIVVDASFISLRLLLPPLEKLLAPEGHMVLLVKPQFEAGRERVGKGGVVRDAALHVAILQEILAFVRQNSTLVPQGFDVSPLKGPEGNLEFLLWLRFPYQGREGVVHEETVRDVVTLAHAPQTKPRQECGIPCPQNDA